jgi:hypothetical protein
MKAKNREEFEAIWKEHFRQIYVFLNSLPDSEQVSTYGLIKKLESLVPIASEHAFKKKEEAQQK